MKSFDFDHISYTNFFIKSDFTFSMSSDDSNAVGSRPMRSNLELIALNSILISIFYFLQSSLFLDFRMFCRVIAGTATPSIRSKVCRVTFHNSDAREGKECQGGEEGSSREGRCQVSRLRERRPWEGEAQGGIHGLSTSSHPVLQEEDGWIEESGPGR
jgi:hypothetical protein